jgi:hypothetical protein
MEPGQRALSFVFERGASGAIAPVFLHYPSWYGGLKQGVVDPSVASTYVKLVLYRPDRIPVARLWDFEWLPERWNWQRFGGERYRYFVVRSLDDKHRLFDDATCRVSLLLHVNLWWLYERDPSCRTASVE